MNKNKILTVSIVSLLFILGLSGAYFQGSNSSWLTGYREGRAKGYNQAVDDYLNYSYDPQKTSVVAKDSVGFETVITDYLFKDGQTTLDLTMLSKGWSFVNQTDLGITYVSVTHNVMLDKGVERMVKIYYGNVSTGTSGAATTIGFSSVQYTPVQTDTSCTNLITTNGLNPQVGTPTYGTASAGLIWANITKVFTVTTGAITAYDTCLMYSTTAGTVVQAADISDAVLDVGDQLTQTWATKLDG